MARKPRSKIPLEAFMPHSDVLPTLRQHPPGWIGTMVSEGRPPVAICLKEAWHKHRPRRAAQVSAPRFDGRDSDDYYFFIDESQPSWPLAKR